MEQRATPITTAASPGAISQPASTPAARLMNQPPTARRPVRPWNAPNSISEPATKNSIASPNFDEDIDEGRLVGPPEHGRADDDAEDELEHHDRHTHPAPQRTGEHRRHDREDEDQHDGDVLLAHGFRLATPSRGMSARCASVSSGARRLGVLLRLADDGCRFRPLLVDPVDLGIRVLRVGLEARHIGAQLVEPLVEVIRALAGLAQPRIDPCESALRLGFSLLRLADGLLRLLARTALGEVIP